MMNFDLLKKVFIFVQTIDQNQKKTLSKQKKTTIKDIANVLNITPSAVSKALNNHPRISQKTRDAVIQVAKNLDIHPVVLEATDSKNFSVRTDKDWEKMKGRAIV